MGFVHKKGCCGDFGDEESVMLDPAQLYAAYKEAEHIPPNPDEMYSEHFSLRDLTVTSLPHPNLPLDQVSQDNLRLLGTLLDTIKDNIGDFAIASAYRSPENQAALQSGAQGATSASMAIKKSYHSLGLAADLTPLNGMTPTQFAQAIYLNPLTNVQVGQIADKSEAGQSSLHISIRTPKFTEATPMDAHYVRLTKDQINAWLASSIPVEMPIIDSSYEEMEEGYVPQKPYLSEEYVDDEEYYELEQPKKAMSPYLIGGIVASLLAGLLIMNKRKA